MHDPVDLPSVQSTGSDAVPTAEEIRELDAYWRAANYLAAGQIYLMDNPLLRRPLVPEDIKPRLLGHWGTSPGLNFLYAHLERVINDRALPPSSSAVPVTEDRPSWPTPGWRAPTASTIPTSSRWRGHGPPLSPVLLPGRHPQPCSPETPGSLHEGGELGYSLSHAFGAAFDNPDLIVACVVGDGEAEQGRRHRVAFEQVPDPRCDGAVLPDTPPERLQDRHPPCSPVYPLPSCSPCSPAMDTGQCWSRADSTARVCRCPSQDGRGPGSDVRRYR